MHSGDCSGALRTDLTKILNIFLVSCSRVMEQNVENKEMKNL